MFFPFTSLYMYQPKDWSLVWTVEVLLSSILLEEIDSLSGLSHKEAISYVSQELESSPQLLNLGIYGEWLDEFMKREGLSIICFIEENADTDIKELSRRIKPDKKIVINAIKNDATFRKFIQQTI